MDLYQTGGTSPPTITGDQHRAAERLRALPGRHRVITDREGWPLIPGRTGQIEAHDPETLAVFTARPRMVAKLLALPGVRRHQTGDTEARLLFPPSSFPLVAQLIGARRRRSLSPDAARTLGAGTAYRPTKCLQEAPIPMSAQSNPLARPPTPASTTTGE